MEGWRVILDPAGAPTANMDRDMILAEQVRQGVSPPTVRLYGWDREAISLGRRQALDDLPRELVERGLPTVRRPTGGGAVIHRVDELTYSIAIPHAFLPAKVKRSQMTSLLHEHLRKELLTLRLVHPEELVLVHSDSTGPAPLCFLSPQCGDLLYQGRKVAGAALRVWREGLLIQGSIQGLPVEYNQLVSAFRNFGEGWS